MRRAKRLGPMAVVLAGGCASVAPVDNPVLVRPADAENPVLVAPGQPDPASYADVTERVIEVLNDYFVLKPTARYGGYIESEPRVAPGYEQPWKPGSPDPRERLLATFQTYRHVASARIVAGERGGYRVTIEVRKELEYLRRPERATTGAALFREATTIDRISEVVGPGTNSDTEWIRAGRDYAFEQKLLREIQERAASCR